MAIDYQAEAAKEIQREIGCSWEKALSLVGLVSSLFDSGFEAWQVAAMIGNATRFNRRMEVDEEE